MPEQKTSWTTRDIAIDFHRESSDALNGDEVWFRKDEILDIIKVLGEWDYGRSYAFIKTESLKHWLDGSLAPKEETIPIPTSGGSQHSGKRIVGVKAETKDVLIGDERKKANHSVKECQLFSSSVSVENKKEKMKLNG
jgi:hypothetical protein